jgi:probable phosphoglycerate mutase
VLVRHAPSDWSGRRYSGRGSDPPLGAAGRAIARDVARSLAPSLPGAIGLVSSPLRRATETAEAIASALGRPGSDVELDPRWAEVDVGVAAGRTFDELAADEPDLAARLAAGETAIDWPGGETDAAFTARVAAAWSDLLAAGRPTVVVSHAGPIRLALALAAGVPPATVSFPAPGEARWWPSTRHDA